MCAGRVHSGQMSLRNNKRMGFFMNKGVSKKGMSIMKEATMSEKKVCMNVLVILLVVAGFATYAMLAKAGSLEPVALSGIRVNL
jgi:hypothetical protein